MTEVPVLFLIDYDRIRGALVSRTVYRHDQRAQAIQARIDLEIELNGHAFNREIVLLEASSEEDLKRTHRRYFEDLQTLANEDLLAESGEYRRRSA